ncbi:hypothetical protein [uncultured Lactobacillus sp.]|uniref:hypothetical protein n=1 Tax=uncultured Lactobacillus sp. TaxID=153152 RepID=UPI0025D9C45E|nr:hypothetical protein [uncultured Lactobacillus sp.]
MIKIENDKYQVEINEIGAELTHFVLKNVDYDLIWNDPDGSIWKRHHLSFSQLLADQIMVNIY